MRKLFFIFIICLLLISCNKQELKVGSETINLTTLNDPTVTDLFKIGRVLFYDKTLSVNNAVSCGSCHKQTYAFSDNKRFSTGFEGKMSTRNTPTIQNLNSSGSLFWDGRENSLSSMVFQPIFNHDEMGVRDENSLLAEIRSKPYYQELFSQAYFDGKINSVRIRECLVEFVGSIASFNSTFDNRNLQGDAKKGFEIFVDKYNCAVCHDLNNPSGYTGSSSVITNIGLDVSYADNGLGNVSNNVKDNGKFKVPNLRNVMLTAPYMHDGRFNTIDEVLDHYASGVKNHPNLDPFLKDSLGTVKTFIIEDEDRRLIKVFLSSLTDNNFTTTPKFSNPFK